MSLDAAVSGVTFLFNRATGSAERIAQGQDLSGAARTWQTGVSAANLVDPTIDTAKDIAKNVNNPLVRNNLEKIVGKVAGTCTDDATNFVGKSVKVLKGCGLAANITYAATKALEQDNVVDGGIVAFSGLGGMYAAENAYNKGIQKTAIKLTHMNPAEAKGAMKFLAKASKFLPKAPLGLIAKGIGFVAASFTGVYLGEKAGEFIVKH